MKSGAIALLGVTLLSACELAAIPAAPVVGAIIAVDYLSKSLPKVDQPLKVIGPSGNTLAEPFDPSTKPRKTVRISSSALTCVGSTRIKCNTGQTGAVSIVSAAQLGSSLFSADLKLSASDTVQCTGDFYSTDASAGPFGVDCTYRLHEWADFTKTDKVWVAIQVKGGAAVVQNTSSGSSQVTLWIPPAT